ncbi:putative protein-lysine deacylase ABHD14B isoform X2 [Ptychodera flava]
MNVSVNKPVLAGIVVAVIVIYIIWSSSYPSSESKMSTGIPEELKYKEDGTDAKIEVKDERINIEGATGEVFYRVAVDARQALKIRGNVLLLHGMKFSSEDWFKLKTIHQLAKFGYRVVAVDLPGFKNSKDSTLTAANDDFLRNLIKTLKVEPAVVVSPSMSGSFSLPLLMKDQSLFRGFVPVAPVDSDKYTRADYEKIKVPTMIVYGELDTTLGSQSLENLKNIPNSKVHMLPKAKHPAYLDQPDMWHEILYSFLQDLEHQKTN